MIATIRIALIILAAAISANAIAEVQESVGSAGRDISVNVTPYPYNTDSQGNDLPIEIGRFRVPASHGTRSNNREIELGYVRYIGDENTPGPPIVFLTDHANPSREMQEVFIALRNYGDVIDFSHRGYGLSSPLPPCPDQIAIALETAMSRDELDARTQAYALNCLKYLTESGYRLADYSIAQVVGDLRSLAFALRVDELILVAQDNMTEAALLITQSAPDLIRQAMVSNPRNNSFLAEGFALGALLRRPNDYPANDSPNGASLFRALSSHLSNKPIEGRSQTSSGGQIQLAIGDLDLAFITSLMIFGELQSELLLTDVIGDALMGDTNSLSELTLDIRRKIARPNTIQLVQSFNSITPFRENHQTNFSYALNWPTSAIASSISATQLHQYSNAIQTQGTGNNILIVGGDYYPTYSPSNIWKLSSRYNSSAFVEIKCGTNKLIEHHLQIVQLLIEFISQNRAHELPKTISVCDNLRRPQ